MTPPMLAQATTQPCASAWTPGEVAMLMSVFSSVVIAGIAAAIVKVIEAAKNAKLAVLAATRAEVTSVSNTRHMESVQTQLTQIALNTPSPPAAARSPVVPATFTDAQIRAAGEPDCPEPPTPPPPAKEG